MLLFWSLFLLLMLVAAFRDIQAYRIDNGLVIALLVLFGAYALWHPELVDLQTAGLTALAVFIIGFLFYARGALGAGDVKLITVASLWVPLACLPIFFLTIFISGGLLGLALGGVRFWRGKTKLAGLEHDMQNTGRGGELRQVLDTPIPYGIAIAIGAGVATYKMAEIGLLTAVI